MSFLECLDEGRGSCSGPVEFRMPLSASGRPFPRCDRHWSERLDEQQRINQRYPQTAPADFDPTYAGESWDEEPGVYDDSIERAEYMPECRD